MILRLALGGHLDMIPRGVDANATFDAGGDYPPSYVLLVKPHAYRLLLRDHNRGSYPVSSQREEASGHLPRGPARPDT